MLVALALDVPKRTGTAISSVSPPIRPTRVKVIFGLSARGAEPPLIVVANDPYLCRRLVETLDF